MGRLAGPEYAVADFRRTLPVPDGMDLIQGASAGVGIMGMQMGKHLGASLVIGTSTNTERRLIYIGTTGRTRSLEEHAEVFRAAKENLWNAMEAGVFRMPIDSNFDISEASSALERAKQNKHFGRIMLTLKAL